MPAGGKSLQIGEKGMVQAGVHKEFDLQWHQARLHLHGDAAVTALINHRDLAMGNAVTTKPSANRPDVEPASDNTVHQHSFRRTQHLYYEA